jgi:hypothetical protein
VYVPVAASSSTTRRAAAKSLREASMELSFFQYSGVRVNGCGWSWRCDCSELGYLPFYSRLGSY